jgi:cell wall-associated NlpC family hydrolase
MQYIFYKGAGVNLQTTTRTQIKQGTTISKSNIKRGDLIFFTNASRQNNSGIERVGHVALYLGDNYILHTSSDYAKIEQISAARWGYYIQTQRMI